mmetsp:Transcript_33227/g.50935  ORF Transcript_33227/g.50935 Transcript_33227/m.50935 type:complete len:102 (+) Transcript_33227:52-357(+)|eukprot:CAMPEP_0170491138 /NCGR_PEP_ID=MMETSP0208-20121228/10456_1 /TAXON_ID=197538 /ORGANISM="Strombidium inclinatum, Strain S3" /LENGTH=101 /DNA_ID=CAMNT_0010766661 /DNA_START=27 /DNA_END=332 /DNA_ORIENTATION=+
MHRLIQVFMLAASAVQAFNFFDTKTDAKSDFLEATRPMFDFPTAFSVGISSNDPGLNLTEVIYYDRSAKKIRMQTYYSLLGLEPTKGLDMVMDEVNQRVAI